MNSRVIRALLKKDFALFMSNRFYMLITFLGLIFYVGIYFILPSEVDEKIGLALYAPVVPPAFTQLTGEDSIAIEYFSDAELLKQSVLNGDYDVALSLPDNIMGTGQTREKPEIIIITLFIGSLMVTGISFLLASLARDIMAVTGWGMLILVIFAIPGFGSVVPGLLSDWAKIIPSYYLTDTMNRIVNYGAGWPDVGMNLVILTIFTIVVVCGGMVTLRRRYR